MQDVCICYQHLNYLLGSKEPKLTSSAESKMVSMHELNFLKVGLSNNSSIDNSCCILCLLLSFFFFLTVLTNKIQINKLKILVVWPYYVTSCFIVTLLACFKYYLKVIHDIDHIPNAIAKDN